jgi:hypothetical protein
VELEQVISSLDAGYTGEDSQEVIESLQYKEVFLIDEEVNAVIRVKILVPAHLHHALLGSRAEAFMAGPSGETLSTNYDKSIICADYGASMIITQSLANTTDVLEKTIIADNSRIWRKVGRR